MSVHIGSFLEDEQRTPRGPDYGFTTSENAPQNGERSLHPLAPISTNQPQFYQPTNTAQPLAQPFPQYNPGQSYAPATGYWQPPAGYPQPQLQQQAAPQALSAYGGARPASYPVQRPPTANVSVPAPTGSVGNLLVRVAQANNLHAAGAIMVSLRLSNRALQTTKQLPGPVTVWNEEFELQPRVRSAASSPVGRVGDEILTVLVIDSQAGNAIGSARLDLSKLPHSLPTIAQLNIQQGTLKLHLTALDFGNDAGPSVPPQPQPQPIRPAPAPVPAPAPDQVQALQDRLDYLNRQSATLQRMANNELIPLQLELDVLKAQRERAEKLYQRLVAKSPVERLRTFGKIDWPDTPSETSNSQSSPIRRSEKPTPVPPPPAVAPPQPQKENQLVVYPYLRYAFPQYSGTSAGQVPQYNGGFGLPADSRPCYIAYPTYTQAEPATRVLPPTLTRVATPQPLYRYGASYPSYSAAYSGYGPYATTFGGVPVSVRRSVSPVPTVTRYQEAPAGLPAVPRAYSSSTIDAPRTYSAYAPTLYRRAPSVL